MAGTVHTDAYRALLSALVQARQDAGLSQADLANYLRKPPSFVGKYELGERRLDVIELLVILKILGVDTKKFVADLAPNLPADLG
ncbi:helix-turn-helix transcriptional regulator [Paracoccus sp. (in: a-proteobacteria)]|uniref:helix-turn-helix domain-containing protein n=1 Tax=Paracoccus sp. TaxID=267 RepID=UPI002AFE4B51|nr:helix-turn-helix transcriptional regulator [Paracoccus sp. (in: a-proteobacteria)]